MRSKQMTIRKYYRMVDRKHADIALTHFLFSALYEAGDFWERVDLEAEARAWARFSRRNQGVYKLVYEFLDLRELLGLERVGLLLEEYDD